MSNIFRDILEHGCSDHGCYFKKPTGMGTNGGCRCLASVSGSRSTIQSLKPLVERLALAIEVIDELTEVAEVHLDDTFEKINKIKALQ